MGRGAAACLAGFVLLSLPGGCSEDTNPPPAPAEDTIAPGVVGDLEATDTSASSVALRWSAPADDDTVGGSVAAYDLRYRLDNLDGGVWDTAMQAENEPTPSDPGEIEVFVLGGLLPDTQYAVGLRSIDDAELISGLSNIVRFRTQPTQETDTIPPAPVSDLDAIEVASTSVVLQWVAPGDDGQEGTAASYDVRYRRGSLDESSWDSAVEVQGEPAPGPAGTVETHTVSDLNPRTDYAFGLRTFDDVGNRSPLSNIVVATTGMGTPEFLDPRGIDGHPEVRDVYVADHGDSSIYRTGMLGTPSRLATIPGAVGVVAAGSGLFYVIAGDEATRTGSLWSFGGSTVDPELLAEGFAFPSDIEIDPNGNILVAIHSPGAILRYGPLGGDRPDSLVQLPEAAITGVAADAGGNLFYGVVRGTGAAIEVLETNGATRELRSLESVGDLVGDPDQIGIWVLDPAGRAVLRLSYDGATLDTLATGLSNPVGITPAMDVESVLYYSSSDGFVLQVELAR